MNALMASGRYDLLLSPVPQEDELFVTASGLEQDEDGPAIENGASVVVRNGRIRSTVTVRLMDSRENFYPSIELHPRLARKLKLLAKRRYRMEYDESAKTVVLSPSPISGAIVPVAAGTAKLPPGALSIGYSLRAALGIPDDRGFAVTVRVGALSKRLTVTSPANLLDRGIRLAPSVLRALRIPPNAKAMLRYDQTSRTLAIGRAVSSGGQTTGGAR